MTRNFNSFIIFEHYRVDNIFFKINNKFNGVKEIEIDTKFTIDHNYLNEQKNRIEVSVACELFNDDFQKDKDPFYLSLSVTGEFSLNPEYARRDGVSEEVIEDTMRSNTLAILFPYVRSTITSITSAANISPVILPPVNTTRLLKAKK